MPRLKPFSLDTALDTLTELFLERGYAALSIGDIGDALGVSRSTIYYTFGTKAELFATLLDRYGPARAPGLRELRDGPAPRAALVQMFEPESGDGAAPRCLVLDTIVKMPDSSPAVAGLVGVAVEDLQECFGAAIERGQAAGGIASGVDPAQAAAALLGLYLRRYVLLHSGAARESVLAAVARQAQALVPPPAKSNRQDSPQNAEALAADGEAAVGLERRDTVNRGARNDGADLESALQECRQAARDGLKIAQESLRSTKVAHDRMTHDLRQIQESDFPGIHEVLEQFQRFGSDLDARQQESRERLEKARRGMDDFSIALFGRTMAGKSTLMEILTDGDGASIGKGAQRTTRDVRSYRWRGLTVTDVPGISAFEGAEDERSAFDAAKNADLVLFLITDDAPQPAEAECFARVRALGKPLIGICNVKKALEDEDDLRRFLHAPERCFDMSRLQALQRSFHELAAKHNAGAPVFFVFTHLLARFVARRSGHRHRCKDLQRASRFSVVERRIVDMIVRDGTFLRIKRFIDLAANPSGQTSNELLDLSARNADDGRVDLGSKREIETWFSTSRSDWKDRVEAFVSTIGDNLRAEIPEFVEDHYQDPVVKRSWESVVTRHNIKRAAQRFQEELHEECSEKLAEHSRQLERARQFVGDFAQELRISLSPISDSKRAWNWSTIAVEGLLAIGALFAGPVLIGVAAGVRLLGRLFGGFFEDREEKASRQREKLSKTLHAYVERLVRDLRPNLCGWLNKSIVDSVETHVSGLQTAADSKFILANAQRTLAWTLNRERKKLHRLLLCKALHQLGAGQHINLIRDIARVPGTAMMLVIDPGTRFPDPIRRKLQDIMAEKIWFVVNTNPKSIVRQALRLECDFREINIEERIPRVVHVPVADLDATGRARVELTQQLTELQVMKSAPEKGRL